VPPSDDILETEPDSNWCCNSVRKKLKLKGADGEINCLNYDVCFFIE